MYVTIERTLLPLRGNEIIKWSTCRPMFEDSVCMDKEPCSTSEHSNQVVLCQLYVYNQQLKEERWKKTGRVQKESKTQITYFHIFLKNGRPLAMLEKKKNSQWTMWFFGWYVYFSLSISIIIPRDHLSVWNGLCPHTHQQPHKNGVFHGFIHSRLATRALPTWDKCAFLGVIPRGSSYILCYLG